MASAQVFRKLSSTLERLFVSFFSFGHAPNAASMRIYNINTPFK